MKTALLFTGLMLLSGLAHAQTPECTTEPREKWMKSDEMKKKAELMGYKIKKFMTLEKCFEITGELDGKKVTHHFNPVDGTVVAPTKAGKK